MLKKSLWKIVILALLALFLVAVQAEAKKCYRITAYRSKGHTINVSGWLTFSQIKLAGTDFNVADPPGDVVLQSQVVCTADDRPANDAHPTFQFDGSGQNKTCSNLPDGVVQFPGPNIKILLSSSGSGTCSTAPLLEFEKEPITDSTTAQLWIRETPEIPTFTNWGMIILIALIIIAGVYLWLRRKPVTA